MTSYELGTSSNQLVSDIGIAKSAVLKLLRNNGVTVRNQGLSTEAIADAVNRYRDGSVTLDDRRRT